MSDTVTFHLTMSKTMLYFLLLTIAAALLTIYMIDRTNTVGENLHNESGNALYEQLAD